MNRSIYKPEYRLLLKFVREARTNAGVTQNQLADRLGVTQAFISKSERGERRLDVTELFDICAALAVDPIRLLVGYLDGIRSIRPMAGKGKRVPANRRRKQS